MRRPTLVISDLHLPFEHKDALKHCVKVANRHSVGSIVCIGDIFDHHRISRHVSEPDSYSAVTEFKMTLRKIKKWYKAFPEVKIVDGNHDLIPYRQAKELGIPRVFIKDLKDLYEMPHGWSFQPRLIKDDVLYLHIGGSGKFAAMNKAKDMSMSVVCGHTHRHPGVIYYSNPNSLYFGMNVGCLIDKATYAMRYSNTEPTLGCGVVYSSTEAYFVPMKM